MIGLITSTHKASVCTSRTDERRYYLKMIRLRRAATSAAEPPTTSWTVCHLVHVSALSSIARM